MYWRTLLFQIMYTTLVVGVMLILLHFSTRGRIWKTFTYEDYKCGAVSMLSERGVPNVSGLYADENEAAAKLLQCNRPQAFAYGNKLCTMQDGQYKCQNTSTSTSTGPGTTS